jgi:hypothetical protein
MIDHNLEHIKVTPRAGSPGFQSFLSRLKAGASTYSWISIPSAAARTLG